MSESGFLAPTDSRLRGDQRLFEQGKLAEADEEKIRLEIIQRAQRKERADNNEEYRPKFFTEDKEVNPFTKESEIVYRLKKGDDSYWARRENKNWDDL